SFRGRVKPCDKEMADLLYKAGCRRVQLGIEATEQEIIDLIRKNIKITDILEVLKIYKSSGIITLGYFIIGFPTQTLEDCKISFKKMQQFGFDYIYMTKLVPYPKTIIYEQILEQKLLDKDYWYDFILNPTPNYILPNWHPYCSKDELNDLLIKNYRSFYISPKFILKELKRTKSLNQLLKKIKVSLSLNFLKQN
ncbi:MAG TPA: radical SAM protein, partial [bacterium]|nr:radical SAM protein [bacterium]